MTTKPREATAPSESMRGVGRLLPLWRIALVLLLSALIALNVVVLRHKPTPVGPEQGGVAELQNKVSSLEARLKMDEKVNTDLQGDLKVVTDKLKITQGQLKKARMETEKQNTETTEKLTALDTSVHSELATKASNDDVETVDTKVTAVSDNLAKTNNDLSMARSELGTLIAHNHDEIDVLRRIGDRDYIEFTITSKNRPQKVGNVTIELKGVNEKRNQFSLVVIVEDKRFEKKNRALNEPIFFYASGARIPEEIVINKVSDKSVSGYVSIPKTPGP